MSKNICYIYKNDLKFNNDINMESSEFESENIKIMYKNYKQKPKIELRIEDSKIENYEYLDLSKLEIDDKYLDELFKLERIVSILKKIKYLDLSNNNLKSSPNISKYKNILYLNISFNEISGKIVDNNLIELSCNNNNLESIDSKSLIRLNSCNNILKSINTPNIEILIINNNKLNYLESYINLKYLEIIDNQLIKIDNLINLEELYIGNNNIIKIEMMPKLKVLNCINNPILKIKYFLNLNTLMTSTPNISSNYKIANISKVKKDYLINFSVI